MDLRRGTLADSWSCLEKSVTRTLMANSEETTMDPAYLAVQASHASLPAFSPAIPTFFLPYLAFFLLTFFFLLAFYFSTLPKNLLAFREFIVATLASVVAGFGVVALFCSVGVYV
ncbi:hypothetical protein BS47DRAFT_360955 [Hydnum rufescens UP504]|uniref:Dolichyl-diphosphooligosaccharide-protein glycosyltransferase subunit OST5 n=1 Tax=Hydnum rufescens UP504 TaxID=1448309 RepID=A0A9P6DQ45_9AGAM|nr:hypothetical protein BS47DRAFT_360955 [Hydnum rufescens UP504]